MVVFIFIIYIYHEGGSSRFLPKASTVCLITQRHIPEDAMKT